MATEIVSSWTYAGMRYVVAVAAEHVLVVATDPHDGSRRMAWADDASRDSLADVALEWNALPALPRTRRAEGLLAQRHGLPAAAA